MRDITIIVNNIRTIVVWAKEHPKAALYSAIGCAAALVTIFRFVFMDVPKWWNELVLRDSIYITQFETGRKLIPLNADSLEVPSINPIKANESTTIRYALVQGNKNAPQITAIIVQFPNDAKVTPDSWRGLTWEKNNDADNRWGLAISPFEVFSKGSPYCLPALHVTFKRTGLIPFSYQINVNKMDPIQHSLTINTNLKYDDYLKKTANLWANEVNPDTYRLTYFSHGDDKQSVSASSCASVYPAAPTVSADSSTMNK